MTAEPGLPSLPVRVAWAFFSPGKLMQRLAEEPRWVVAMLVGAVLAAASIALLPVDLMIEAQRQAVLERGGEFPETTEQMAGLYRTVFPLFAAVWSVVISFVVAGVCAVVFGFVMGDEGRYVQYLAAVVHAWFIPALIGVLLTPLRIAAEDPQVSLSLASFFFFLPDGYVYSVLRALDLTFLWSMLVIAQGAHAIDDRRSFGSAAAILLGIAFVVIAGLTGIAHALTN